MAWGHLGTLEFTLWTQEPVRLWAWAVSQAQRFVQEVGGRQAGGGRLASLTPFSRGFPPSRHSLE